MYSDNYRSQPVAEEYLSLTKVAHSLPTLRFLQILSDVPPSVLQKTDSTSTPSPFFRFTSEIPFHNSRLPAKKTISIRFLEYLHIPLRESAPGFDTYRTLCRISRMNVRFVWNPQLPTGCHRNVQNPIPPRTRESATAPSVQAILEQPTDLPNHHPPMAPNSRPQDHPRFLHARVR